MCVKYVHSVWYRLRYFIVIIQVLIIESRTAYLLSYTLYSEARFCNSYFCEYYYYITYV